MIREVIVEVSISVIVVIIVVEDFCVDVNLVKVDDVMIVVVGDCVVVLILRDFVVVVTFIEDADFFVEGKFPFFDFVDLFPLFNGWTVLVVVVVNDLDLLDGISAVVDEVVVVI